MAWNCTVLHQSLDLVHQRQSAELGHGQHITGTHRLHTINRATNPANVKGRRLLPSELDHVWRTYAFSSARGGISIARYSLQTHVIGLFSERPQNHSVKLRMFREAAEIFRSLWSFDELGVLGGVGRLAEQVLTLMLRAAVLQEQHTRRHNQTQRTRSSGAGQHCCWREQLNKWR